MQLLRGALILSGVIIGVGMFGLPFAVTSAGFLLGAVQMAVLTGVVLVFHLLYGRIVLATPDFHRLPGYVRTYLGTRAASVSYLSAIIGISGTLLAYLTVGGIFLTRLFPGPAAVSGLGPLFWTLVMAGVGALLTMLPKQEALKAGSVLTALLVVLIFLLAFMLLPHIEVGNLMGFHPEKFFQSYGVLLFALSGGVIIPDMIAVLGRNRSTVHRAIILGTLIPAVVYILFTVAVVGAVGPRVTPDAIGGLQGVVGTGVLVFGSAVGFLAVFTSLVNMSTSFQALLSLDLGFSRAVAWLAAWLVPLGLYLSGFRDFVTIIATVGALAIGTDSLLIILTYHTIEKEKGVMRPFWSVAWKTAIGGVILSGVLYQLAIIYAF